MILVLRPHLSYIRSSPRVVLRQCHEQAETIRHSPRDQLDCSIRCQTDKYVSPGWVCYGQCFFVPMCPRCMKCAGLFVESDSDTLYFKCEQLVLPESCLHDLWYLSYHASEVLTPITFDYVVSFNTRQCRDLLQFTPGFRYIQ